MNSSTIKCTLLREFLQVECTLEQVVMILSNLESGPRPYQEYNFNIFDLYVDFSEKIVKLENILATDSASSAALELDEFVQELKKQKREKS